MSCLGLRAADDEVRQPKRAGVCDAKHVRRDRSWAEVAAHGDELVLEREDRVEDERAFAGDAPRLRHVEMPGIADDHRVGRDLPRREEAELGIENVHEPAHAATFELSLALEHLDAGVA